MDCVVTATTPKPSAELVAAFGRLFDNEFLTLDGVTISYRVGRDISYLDERSALDAMLFDEEAATMSSTLADETQALHLALYAADPDTECVISGWSRHLRALLLEGFPPPPPTSMMRKRGIHDVSAHLVAADALEGSRLAASIEQARTLAKQNGMRHLLLLSAEGMVVMAGKPLNEAVSHWHNVEFAARVECLRIEEARMYPAQKRSSGG